MSESAKGSWWRDRGAVDRLKRDADLSGLVRAHGVDLKSEGADLVGLCPFHAETTPSFRVTPSKGLWHCFGCGKGGSAVDWLVATRGVSIREAFDALRQEQGVVQAGSLSQREKLVESFDADPEGSESSLLLAVCSWYQRHLHESSACREYLEKRGLWDAELVKRFRLGYADRSLGYAVGARRANVRKRKLRERLTSLGVIRESGHEHLNGSLVVPILSEPDGAGVVEVLGMYGRKVRNDLRPGTPSHLYLKGEHVGVFNAAGVRGSGSDTVVLCEALLDALTLIRWGIENVTSAYGVHGVSRDLWSFLTTSGFRRVVIAFDADDAGNGAALELSSRLNGEGLEVQRMNLPVGMDVNDLARASSDPQSALRGALEGASWMGEGAMYQGVSKIVVLERSPEPPAKPIQAQVPEIDVNPELAPSPSEEPPKAKGLSFLAAAPASAAPAAPVAAVPDAVPAEPPSSPSEDPDRHSENLGDRHWLAKGLSRNRSGDTLRVTLRVTRIDTQGRTWYHLDTLDLYSAKARDGFVRSASSELGLDTDVVRSDLSRLVISLEARQEVLHEASRRPPAPVSVEISPLARQEALALLHRPDMLCQLLSDLSDVGMVGEEENKLLCWLSLTSRRLESPLGVLIQSTSAAGKSSLLDGVLKTMPEEEVVRYSAMSGQALFYMGGVSLKHKILCVAEEEGARRASYSLKLLQSDGVLSMASTTKDADSGQLVTREYKTEGPVALAMTTTSIDVDPELQNRCLVLSVDESREQTEAIHRIQRMNRTREGQLRRRLVGERMEVWRNAQRLLSTIEVVNPFAQTLTFASHRTRTRRDMAKYLTLVEAVALAHQHQKPRLHDEQGEYIEVDLDDIELANQLSGRVLGRNLDDLPSQTAELLRRTVSLVSGEAVTQGLEVDRVGFTRRWLRERTGLGDTQLKVHLRRLEELEYLSLRKCVGGQAGHGVFEYRLSGLSVGPDGTILAGLMDLSALRRKHPQAPYRGTWSGTTQNRSGSDLNRSGVNEDRSAPGRREVRPMEGRSINILQGPWNGDWRSIKRDASPAKSKSVGVLESTYRDKSKNGHVVVPYVHPRGEIEP